MPFIQTCWTIHLIRPHQEVLGPSRLLKELARVRSDGKLQAGKYILLSEERKAEEENGGNLSNT